MVKKSEILWNSIASTIAALLNSILLLFCTRVNGTEIAGMFSIAFATATILNAIGDYGIRIYQVTDTKRTYKFGEYLGVRIVVTMVMLIIGIVFVIASGYETEKLFICICLILFRFVDNLSETYQGEFQLNQRLDLGAKSVIIRNIVAILFFVISDYITKNVVISFGILFISNLIMFVLYDLRYIKKFTSEKIKFNKTKIKEILKECFPVFVSTLLSLYITNATKYAIDAYGNYEMQTIYNIIYLPAFTINLASVFIIKPMLKVLGDLWNDEKYNEMIKIVLKIVAIIVGFTFIVEIVCLCMGIPLLEFIYGIQIDMYIVDLLILVLSGGFYAISVLLLYVLTTMRSQLRATFAYIVASIFIYIVSNFLVKNYQMRGATISNLLGLFILVVIMCIIFIIDYLKINRKIKKVQNVS